MARKERTPGLDLWTAWWDAGRVGATLAETAFGAQAVIAARLPLLAAAAQTPAVADTGELALMVSEKATAFARTTRAGVRGARRAGEAAAANARDAARLAEGRLFGPADWWRIAERNLAAFGALAALPGAMLAPVHRSVTANARRLRGSSRKPG